MSLTTTPLLVSNLNPSSKRKRDELAVAMNSAKSQAFEVACWTSANWKCAIKVGLWDTINTAPKDPRTGTQGPEQRPKAVCYDRNGTTGNLH